MKKLIIASVVATAFMTGSAFAGNPGKGNQGCSWPTADLWKNPGKAFQYIREVHEENPAMFVKNNDFVWDPDPENVGEYIELLCQRPSNAP